VLLPVSRLLAHILKEDLCLLDDLVNPLPTDTVFSRQVHGTLTNRMTSMDFEVSL
jgi:hypothetical protein